MLAGLALLIPVAEASAGTKARVKRAVREEVEQRYFTLRSLSVSCQRLSGQKYKCSYVGFEGDASSGPCRGRARATVYPQTVDVTSVSRPRCDFD